MAWTLAKSLQQLSSEVNARFPGTTIWSIGDASHQRRDSDHNPNHEDVVCAIDVVGRTQASQLWEHLLRQEDFRIKYIIFDRQIVNSTVHPWRVRPYGGSNPHTGHIHISVGRGRSGHSTRADLYQDSSTWHFSSSDSPTTPKDKPPSSNDHWIQEVLDGMGEVDLRHGVVITLDAKRLQGCLMSNGFGPAGLVNEQGLPDGIGGPETAALLESFQSHHGLKADRIAGPNTWDRLLNG